MPFVSGYFDQQGRRKRVRYAPGTQQAAMAHGSSYARKRRSTVGTFTASKTRYRSTFRTKGRGPSVALQTRLTVPTVIERMQGVKSEEHNDDPDTIIPGFYPMPFLDTAAAADDYPIVMFALTGLNNNNFGDAVNTALQFSPTGGVTWSTLTGPSSQQANGTLDVGGRFRLEKQLSGGRVMGDTQPYKATHVQMPWFDIRFQLWGCKKQAVTWDISLIQFRYEWMCPDADTSRTADEILNFNAFWQSLARTQTLSSILPGQVNQSRFYRVLKHKRVTLEPTVNDQNAISANVFDLKWFVRHKKLLRYDRFETTQFATSDAMRLSSNWITKFLGTSVENRPLWNQRVYVMVRATDYNPSVTGADAGQFDSPSFSYCIRRKVHAYGNGGGEV